MNQLSIICIQENGDFFMGGNILLNTVNLTHFSFWTVIPDPNLFSNFIQQFCFRRKNTHLTKLIQFRLRLYQKEGG